MKQKARITVLMDDAASRPGLAAEHGMACFLEHEGSRVLFDTGAGEKLIDNAHALKVPIEKTDAIVLSHGHSDHTGGLKALLKIMEKLPAVYVHPDAFGPKYSRAADGTVREISMPGVDQEYIIQNAASLVYAKGVCEAAPGVFLTGQIPNLNDFEDTGGDFFQDKACRNQDMLLDDLALFFEAKGGAVILTGCAHSGVINTMEYVRRLTMHRNLHAVLGGMHLVNATHLRIRRTLLAFEAFNVTRIAPGHCTGEEAMKHFERVFPKKLMEFKTGSVMEFDL